MADKRDFWVLKVQETSHIKVCFDKDLTAQEAIDAYNDWEYEDVIDEETITTEAVAVVE